MLTSDEQLGIWFSLPINCIPSQDVLNFFSERPFNPQQEFAQKTLMLDTICFDPPTAIDIFRSPVFFQPRVANVLDPASFPQFREPAVRRLFRLEEVKVVVRRGGV